jgi:4-amino-4-deoxy-L-arabinose transferase-like glycosyltransferase
MIEYGREHRVLLMILTLALGLRLAFALAQDPLRPYEATGGDSRLYLQIGQYLMSGYDYSRVSIPMAPVYLVLNGLAQILFSPAGAIIVLRLLQAIMGTATCYFAYRLARLLSRDERAGLIAAGVVALSPVFIIESAQILTETLYIFLVTSGLWLYAELIERVPKRRWLWLTSVGLLLGLATLTRAVLLAFPVGLVIHLLLVYGWRGGLKRGAVLVVAYSLTVSTWTVWNLVKWNRFVVGAEGLSAFIFIGAVGWKDPAQLDKQLPVDIPPEIKPDGTFRIHSEDYLAGAGKVIGGNPLGWAGRRVNELINAYLQPHGTTFYSGVSLKDLAAGWLRNDRTPAGLLRLTQADSFWPKLVLYMLHFTALFAGMIGLWLSRRQWRLALPLAGFILYTTLVHLALQAIPRYIFPTEVFWWAFAGVALAAAWRWATHRRKVTTQQAQPAHL